MSERTRAACSKLSTLLDFAFLQAIPVSKHSTESGVGVKKTGKGRRKLGRKKRRMRAKIRHRKG